MLCRYNCIIIGCVEFTYSKTGYLSNNFNNDLFENNIYIYVYT